MDKRRAFLQIGCMPLEDLARPHRKRQSMMIGVFGNSSEFHQADEVDEKFLCSLDCEGGNEEGYPVGFTEGVQNSKAPPPASRVSYRDRRERDVRGRPHPSSAQDFALARRGHRLHRWICRPRACSRRSWTMLSI